MTYYVCFHRLLTGPDPVHGKHCPEKFRLSFPTEILQAAGEWESGELEEDERKTNAKGLPQARISLKFLLYLATKVYPTLAYDSKHDH